MATAEEQLVQKITLAVMAELKKRISAVNGGGASNAPAASRAAIHAPMGICTAGSAPIAAAPMVSTPLAAPVTAAAAPVTVDNTPTFTGVIIAKQIENLRGTIRLAPGARLTPAAQDVVRDHKLKVERLAAGGGVIPGPNPRGPLGKPKAAGMGEFVWWIAGNCPVVDKVTPAFRTELAPLPTARQPGALVPVIREISKRIKSGRAAGGILFVPSAATAACFANRCPNLRAVVGTCGAAVEEGIRLVGANVLIVEYPHHGWRTMHEMIERFVRESRPALGEIERQLKELGTCA